MTGEYLFRPYHLPLRRTVAGARGVVDALMGTAVGYARDGHTAWACAPRLVTWPAWQATIDAFARDLAVCVWQADQHGVGLAAWLAKRHGLALRDVVPLALTADWAALADGSLARQARATGVTAVKVKVGAVFDEGALAVAVAELRARCGPIDVRLDANGAWAALSEAALIRRLSAVRAAGIQAVEDPAPWTQWPVAPPLPLALDLLDSDVATMRHLARSGAVGLAVVKPALCGSVAGFLELAADLAAAGVPLAVSSCFDAPFGLAQLAALAAVAPGDLQPSGLCTHLNLAPRWRSPELAVRDGHWRVSGVDAVSTLLAPPWRDLLAQAAARSPRNRALSWFAGGGTHGWSWQRLDRNANRIARGLRQLGLRQGSVVALWCGNSPQLAATLWGIWRAGLVAAPAHPRWTAAEFGRWQDQVAAALSVVDADHPWSGAVPLWDVFGGRIAGGCNPGADHRRDAACALVATSGTTGTPKVVALGMQQLVAAAFSWWQHDPAQQGDRWLLPLPMCHVAGLVGLWRCAAASVEVVIAQGNDTPGITDALRQRSCTLLSVVPTQLQRLTATGAPPRQLRLVLVGGASTPPDVLAGARRAGWPAVPSYGMTETAAALAVGDRCEEPAHAEGMLLVGRALPGISVATGPDDEIWVRGDAVAGSPGHWMASGDAGRLDDRGRLWVGSRRADRIVRGGENIDPIEVEATLRGVAGVDEVAVVGILDAQLGQCVAAWVVSVVAKADLESRVRAALGGLAPFKRPQRWMFTAAALPRNGLGKVDLMRVRQEFAQLAR